MTLDPSPALTTPAEIIGSIAVHLVNDPTSVRLCQKHGLNVLMTSNGDDHGRLVGKRGCHIRALQAMASFLDMPVSLTSDPVGPAQLEGQEFERIAPMKIIEALAELQTEKGNPWMVEAEENRDTAKVVITCDTQPGAVETIAMQSLFHAVFRRWTASLNVDFELSLSWVTA